MLDRSRSGCTEGAAGCGYFTSSPRLLRHFAEALSVVCEHARRRAGRFTAPDADPAVGYRALRLCRTLSPGPHRESCYFSHWSARKSSCSGTIYGLSRYKHLCVA